MSKRNNFFGSFASFTYTPRTIAFLTLIGIPNDGTVFFIGTPQQITGSAIWTAVNNFDLGIITYGLEAALKAIYLMIGGTASAHKLNFMNPLDTDAAFRASYFGGWTHGPTGATPNGINAYANTHINANTHLLNSAGGLTFYSRTNSVIGGYDFGCDSSAGLAALPIFLICRYFTPGTPSYFGWGDNTYGCNVTQADGRGCFTGVYDSSINNTLKKNGTTIKTSTKAAVTLPSRDLYMSAANANGTAGFFSDKECAFSAVHSISVAQAVTFNTLIQNLQTALFRNV